MEVQITPDVVEEIMLTVDVEVMIIRMEDAQVEMITVEEDPVVVIREGEVMMTVGAPVIMSQEMTQHMMKDAAEITRPQPMQLQQIPAMMVDARMMTDLRQMKAVARMMTAHPMMMADAGAIADLLVVHRAAQIREEKGKSAELANISL